MASVTEKAFCKVNLFLDVVGKRADGYHGIESIMVTLPLYDTVTVSLTDGGMRCAFRNSGSLSADLSYLEPEENLALKAARLFASLTGYRGGVDVVIDKKIPSRAGLGGGSADAAATLRALNALTGAPLSTEELEKCASSLGADVPFCVSGGAALCRGIGDEMIKIDNKIAFHGLITSEKAEKRSTAEAYRLVDCAKCSVISCRPKSAEEMACAMERGDFEALCREAYNVFGEACGYPDGARRLLSENGAPFVLMSGAGPSVVALTESAEEAALLGEIIEKEGYRAFCF